MKKISLLIIFIWCFNFQICIACGQTTGGACAIDDLVPPQQPKTEKKIIKPEQKIKNNNELIKIQKTKPSNINSKQTLIQKNKE